MTRILLLPVALLATAVVAGCSSDSVKTSGNAGAQAIARSLAAAASNHVASAVQAADSAMQAASSAARAADSAAQAAASSASAAMNSAAPTGSANGGGSATSATFSGDFSGHIEVNLCAGTIASVKFVVDGDTTSYLGSISTTSAGFIGPGGGPFTVTPGAQKPVSAANGFNVDGVVLTDRTLTNKKVTLAGTVTCPA